MAKEKLNKSRSVKFKNVRESFFSFKYDLIEQDPNQKVAIDLFQTLGVNTEFKEVRFEIGAYLHYNNPENKLSELKIYNFYQLPNMDDYERLGEDIILPGEVLMEMVRESLAHLRAIFSLKLAGTALENIVIPIDDPAAITNYFFPDLIKNKDGKFSKVKGKLED